MIIDCDSCEVRNIACDDCVVSVLLAAPVARSQVPFGSQSAVEVRGAFEWGDEESGALDALASSGLVPPVRMRARRHSA